MFRVILKVCLLALLISFAGVATYAHDSGTQPITDPMPAESDVETSVEDPLEDAEFISLEESYSEPPLELLFASLAIGAAATGGLWWLTRDRYSMFYYGIVGLLIAAGAIHLVLGLQGDLLLLLNGLGYFALLAVRFSLMSHKHPYYLVVAGITITYAIITIIGYFISHEHVDTLGLATKAIEVVLIFLVAVRAFRLSKLAGQGN